MTISVALDVETEEWTAVPALESLATRALDQAGRRSGLPLLEGSEVSVLLSDDATIRLLNRDWRGLDKATNVLSFPTPGPLAARPLLGDIAVSWQTTRREADDEGKPVADHLAHLLVHGFLHLLGYDHERDSEADAMERLETSILADLGIADPYRHSEPVESGTP